MSFTKKTTHCSFNGAYIPSMITSFRVFDIMFVKPIMMSLEISDAEVQGEFIKYKNGNLLLFP